MKLTVKPVTDDCKEKTLNLVEKVFAAFYNPREGKIVRGVVKEIRSKQYYVPELDLMAVDENGEIIGYTMFSRFPLDGKYDDELLILTPVAVKTELQRQHISKEMIEYGLSKAKELGYKAVIVEGDPDNFRSRGFVTAADYGIVPGDTLQLPMVECLMVCELVPGALKKIHGPVDFTIYKSLHGEMVE